jgi:hypothetical protein
MAALYHMFWKQSGQKLLVEYGSEAHWVFESLDKRNVLLVVNRETKSARKEKSKVVINIKVEPERVY